MQHEIKRLDESSLEAAAELVRKSFATVATEFSLSKENCPGNGAFITEERLRQLLHGGAAMFGLYTDVGMAGFITAKRKNETDWYLEKAAVLPEYRHRGFGSRLLRHAEEYILAQEGSRICIGIIAANARLKKWYVSHGFRETMTRSFASLPFLVCYMEKRLSASCSA